MSPGLIRLPATRVDPGALEDLGRCADLVARGRTVLLGPVFGPDDAALDAFAVAAAVAALPHAASLGVVAAVGSGRAASVLAREATTSELLGACDALLLDGAPERCTDAARVITALFAEGAHTVRTPTARVEGARNLPLPSVTGGPPVLWRDGGTLMTLDGGVATPLGPVVVVGAEGTDDAQAAALVEVAHPRVTATELAAVLAR